MLTFLISLVFHREEKIRGEKPSKVLRKETLNKVFIFSFSVIVVLLFIEQ
jgi:hypothetical protein